MDPEAARAVIADEPRYEMTFGEGRSCSVCGANVLGSDRDRHTRWHRALAEVLGLGWEDLSRRPVDPALTSAVDAVLHPRGWAKVSRLVAAHPDWRVVSGVPHGIGTLLIGAAGAVVLRAAGGERVEVRHRVVHVGGHRTGLADELRDAVGRVREVLDVRGGRRRLPVVGVVVASETLEGGDPDPPEVLAATAAGLPDRLALVPATLEFSEVEGLHDRARRSTTWR